MMIHLELLRTKIRPRRASRPASARPRGLVCRAAAAAGARHAPDALQHVEIIESEIRRLDEVVQGFLKFTRPEDLRLQPVRVAALFDEILPVVEPEAQKHNVRVDVDCAASACRASTATPAMLRQAFLNLAINACQAMPNGGSLRLTCAAASRDRVEVASRTPASASRPSTSGRSLISTSRRRIMGRGIGLSMVYRIVQLHDGEVEVQSTPAAARRSVSSCPGPTNANDRRRCTTTHRRGGGSTPESPCAAGAAGVSRCCRCAGRRQPDRVRESAGEDRGRRPAAGGAGAAAAGDGSRRRTAGGGAAAGYAAGDRAPRARASRCPSSRRRRRRDRPRAAAARNEQPPPAVVAQPDQRLPRRRPSRLANCVRHCRPPTPPRSARCATCSHAPSRDLSHVDYRKPEHGWPLAVRPGQAVHRAGGSGDQGPQLRLRDHAGRQGGRAGGRTARPVGSALAP